MAREHTGDTDAARPGDSAGKPSEQQRRGGAPKLHVGSATPTAPP